MNETLTEEQVAFQLILHSGNARSKLIQALREYRSRNIEKVKELLNNAEKDLKEAHQFHFQLIQSESQGNGTNVSLLLIHAEDHLMSTITMKELLTELIELFKDRNI
ncbi:PTS lactose/cellobiose transporter subunit IIA [Bacillus alveayuensis]|uniref:PTS lactose/cellobiose transporter subunit IIA n=1 Tax=Aeribacillus alveayuensis TaxID=279215 RepID=UPI0005D0F519|nr:PTS lactose/cellobiose transporter subunit IIA [Bacillus alveayuensis]